MPDRNTAMPMFPLGTVLVPGGVIPLHLFEDRYRSLIRDVLDGTGEFGVVLIERGSEVGGGESRTSIGTVARVARAEELPDGRWTVIAVGERRIQVDRWLDDDPYPRAVVSDWSDQPPTGAGDRRDACETGLRTVLALSGELGRSAPPIDITLPADPVAASYALTALAPLGPLDRQRLLESPDTDERLELLETFLSEAAEMLRAELRLPRD